MNIYLRFRPEKGILMVVLFSTILTLLPFFLFAQQLGAISGRTVLQNGDPMEGITISIKELKRKTSSNKSGEFSFQEIPVGEYTLEVSHVGWTALSSRIQVKADFSSKVDFKMKLSENALDLVTVIGKSKSFNTNYSSHSLKLDRPLVEIPQSIQIINRSLLEEQQSFTIASGITRNVSGVRTIAHQNDASVSIFVRGFGATNLRNGMSVGGSFGPLREDIAFVDRVEFIKGPAGFLMGNTQPGGLYNVVTKKPMGTGKTSAKLMLGSFSTYRSEVDIDGKLTEDGKLLFRLNAMGSKVGSFIQYSNNELWGLNPSLKYKFSDKTDITAEYTYSQNAFTGGFAKYAYSMKGFKDLPRSFTFSDPIVDPTVIKDHSAFVTLNHELAKDWKVTAQLAYINSGMQGESLYPKFNSINEKGDLYRGISVNDALNTSTLGQIFVNGALKTGDVNHRILAGLDLGSKLYYADWSVLADTVGGVFNIYNPVYGKLKKSNLPNYDRSKSLRERGIGSLSEYTFTSVFVQDELAFFSDKLRLSLGLRYTGTTKTSSAENGKLVKNNAFTPRVGLSATVAPQTSVYALYDQSFQEQVGTLVGGGAVEPSLGTNKEIGAKRSWLNGQWLASIAIFEVTKTNLLTVADPSVPGIMVQTGKARSRGFEFDLKGEIFSGLNVMLNYAYTDAKIVKDNTASRVGNNLDGTAKHITNGWATYRIQEGKTAGLGFSLGYQYEIKRAGWPVVQNKYLPDDLFTLDAGISYVKERYNISLVANNITDRYNYTGYYPGAWTYKHYGWGALAPASFRLSIGYTL
ncbi:TonB-dependent receptor [Pedobacter caeni]|uniref:Iron complex outermembrane recepter protein n=1 Tax=Pedobacter caeni TaxID=288992 RepID=A0A1M5A499_9SPHI|nr:TonB-dependent receptor [Pedobacter caeni]SHF25054.1 iron complex outermembrane recepter protein [Pedobacter caeni]